MPQDMLLKSFYKTGIGTIMFDYYLRYVLQNTLSELIIYHNLNHPHLILLQNILNYI